MLAAFHGARAGTPPLVRMATSASQGPYFHGRHPVDLEEISMRATNVATLLITIALSSVIASCSSGPQIRVDGDPTVNLSSYKTFGFFPTVETDKSKYTTMISSRLKDATRRELQKRGYQEAEANPQLLVNFNTNVENRTDVQSSPSAGYYGYRAGAYGMWAGYPQDVRTTHYQEGTLAIDLVDAAKKQLVWQGIAQARITKSMRENPTETIDSVVADIFAEYPVPPAVGTAQ
jgi:Domain of unknown function (DUF4136)